MMDLPTRSSALLRGLLLLSALSSSSVAAASTTLVDASGSLTKSILPASEGNGLVAFLSSPGTPTPFPSGASTTVNIESNVISAPGASLESESLLGRGIGAAAAGSIAGAVVVTGVTLADVEVGLDRTRHGRTLAELFASVLRMDAKRGKAALMIAVQSDGGPDGGLDAGEIEESIGEIFDGVAAAVGSDDELGDHFSVRIAPVSTAGDASRVMAAARSAAGASSPAPPPAAFSDAWRRIASAAGPVADPTPVAEAILGCNDAYSRASRTSRARIASWRHRASRGLLVPGYGAQAEALLARTLDLFDRDTMASAGLPGVGEERLVIRKKLQDRTEGILRRLFDDQMGILEKTVLKRFQGALLRKMDKDGVGDAAAFFESNGEALRAAAFGFIAGATPLEVPSLSLTMAKAAAEVDGKLNNALTAFPDSPAAKIKSAQKVEQTVSKKKEPSNGASIDVTLDVVAMIRPDGFGNLQGFAGYQLGQHSVTVGVHNDADDPAVIAQFGGVRPPFMRVQPKLKLDVEL